MPSIPIHLNSYGIHATASVTTMKNNKQTNNTLDAPFALATASFLPFEAATGFLAATFGAAAFFSSFGAATYH
jgi:hypothetical protein